ncbi:MAG: MBL fold metallo-hydrolase [Burkholderiaceae bacterium]|nr:MAG: MBL fold metallo-hydrolase [Burkholderiaceae bacterium]
MNLTFLGAAGTVTGSKALLEQGGRRLLVDCGLFQGLKVLRLRNWSGLPLPTKQIEAVLLTHAHLDHSGYIPRLLKLGSPAHIHATGATRDLCELLLPDSGHLLAEEARYANRHRFSRHQPALPLYDEADARQAMQRFTVHRFGAAFAPLPGALATFSPAGHLLGAASVHVEWGGKTLLFSGDLGRDDDLLMQPPATPPAADWVVVESTYGNRTHGAPDPLSDLATAISRAAARGGVIVVPAFAVGRAQTLLYCLHQLKAARRIPDLPVFLNSPMAADATRLYERHAALHRLTPAECAAAFGAAQIVNDVEASKRLNSLRGPAVIVSASGMATGGRVLHHLKAYAPDPRNLILFAGFQAMGTRGAALVGGAQSVKIHGSYVPVQAEVIQLESLSAHADRDGLLAWLDRLPRPPRRVFVNHGEPVAADALRLAIEERFGWPVTVAEQDRRVELD